jgi:hypothetical protein
VQSDAGLDVIGGEAHARVADAVVQRDAAGARQGAHLAILADSVRALTADGVGDLAKHRLHDKVGEVGAEGHGMHSKEGRCSFLKKRTKKLLSVQVRDRHGVGSKG